MTRRNQGSELSLPAGSQPPTHFSERLSKAEGLQDIFELAKEAVWKALKVEQAGLLVGLSELGLGQEMILGAYYSPDANTIVINKSVMNRVRQLHSSQLYNAYCFYIILHEYLHSCGFYDEHENRQIVAAIALEYFGKEHPVARLASTPEAMLQLLQPGTLAKEYANSLQPGGLSDIEFVEGIDRGNTNYIS